MTTPQTHPLYSRNVGYMDLSVQRKPIANQQYALRSNGQHYPRGLTNGNHNGHHKCAYPWLQVYLSFHLAIPRSLFQFQASTSINTKDRLLDAT